MKLNIDNDKIFDVFISDLIIFVVSFFLYKFYVNASALKYICPILLFINSLRVFEWFHIKKIVIFIIDHRLIISLLIFVLLVILKIHGSSIGTYNAHFGDESTYNYELFGKSRPIRSDEWCVQTPMYFSQYYNEFSLISNKMSLAGQDMIIDYNSPVFDITLIGKAFTWGYLLFGNEYGLSWYWCSKLILGLLVCYELFYIILNEKVVSCFGSFFIIFSPAIQWWYCPHMYDVFFWSMALFVVGYYFFMSKNNISKIIFTLLASQSLIGFVLTLFPSLQVPCGLIMLSLLIICIIKNKEDFSFNKFDLIRVAFVVLIVCVILGRYIILEYQEIVKLSGTVYPGKRISLGGNYSFLSLFENINVLFTPFMSPSISNECELSDFNHFGILCFILYPYLLYVSKKNRINNKIVGICGILWIWQAIEIIFMLIGFTEVLAKMTLFKYVNRMYLVYGFTSALFTIIIYKLYFDVYEYCNKFITLCLILLFVVLSLYASKKMPIDNYLNVVTIYGYLIISLALSCIVLLMSMNKTRFALYMLSTWIILTGFTINPIARGIEPITNHQFIKVAKEISKDDDGYWITTDSLQSQELLLANGFKVINGDNFYPDNGKWNILDPSGEFDDVYNRYAHINVSLVKNSESFNASIAYPDSIQISLNINDLKKLGVKYICSMQSYGDLLLESNVSYQEIEINGIYIYHLL